MIESVTGLLNQGGFSAYAAAALGGIGAVFALALFAGIVFGAGSQSLRGMAVVAVLCAFAATGAGIGGAYLARKKSEQTMAKVRPAAAERLRRAGWLESRATLSVALPLVAPAALLALIGFVVAARRRASEFNEEPPAGPGLFIALLVCTTGAWAWGGKMWQDPLPGRDLDDSSWKVLDLADAIDAGDWDKCFTTPWSLGAATPAHALPAHAENQKRCAEHFTSAGDLNRLSSAVWLDDATLREGIKKRAEEAALAAPPAAAPPSTAPPAAAEKDKDKEKEKPESSEPARADPALAMLESKLRHCIKKRSKLELQVNISKDGRVDLPKNSPKCLKVAAAKIKLPKGNARTLEVQIK
jgi:hypothetical protein